MADNMKEIYTPNLGGLPQAGTGKLLHMIFIVDVSGSMRGDGRIAAVNDAFTQMIPALRDIQRKCISEFELRISILTFDQEARWIVNPTPIMEYDHCDIDCSEWVTYFSDAFKKLNEKLTRKEFMSFSGKKAAPYIMFLTDGEPTPEDNYETELDKLLGNGWFVSSMRFAVLIGTDAINSASARKAVSRFVSNPDEGIIDAADATVLASEIQARTLKTIEIATIHKLGQADSDKDDDGDSDSGDIPGGFGGFSGFDRVPGGDDKPIFI